MATLKEKYNNSLNKEFQARLLMALAKRAGVELDILSGGTSTEPTYNRYIRMAQYVLNSTTTGILFFSRIGAAGNLSNANTDSEISTFAVDYWDTLSLLFDPNVPS